jgi:hypothetical protein
MDSSKSKAGTESSSSEKERQNEKTFRIPISNGIFEHYGRLKDARWLLDLFIDWTTKEVPNQNGRKDGIVLGGKPIRDEDTARAFRGQCSTRTTRRWRQRLSRHGYISQKRTPLGYVIRVMKSKKWADRNVPTQQVIGQKWPVRSANNGRTELPDVAVLTGHDRQFRTTDHGRSNKDSAVQDRDRAVEEASAARLRDELPLEEMRAPHLEAWKKIRVPGPVGSVGFRSGWEAWYAENDSEVDSIVWLMESYIQDCQSRNVKVPPPFYAAKRNAEREEQEPEDRTAPANRRPAVQI